MEKNNSKLKHVPPLLTELVKVGDDDGDDDDDCDDSDGDDDDGGGDGDDYGDGDDDGGDAVRKFNTFLFSHGFVSSKQQNSFLQQI